MSTPTSDISVETVGHAFVGQFYGILYSKPDSAYRFFKDFSIMTRPGPTGDLSTVKSLKEINDLILSLDCTSYRAEILTADTQASLMGGVTVLVVGYLTGQDNIQRKFTESFFLAPQDSGYFVHNDTFRFIDEDTPVVPNSVEENCDELELAAPVTAVNPVQEPAEDTTSSLEAQDTTSSLENHTTASKKILEAAKEPEAQQTPTLIERALPQTIVDSNLDVQPVVEALSKGDEQPQPVVKASSNGEEKSPKMSFAALFKNGKQGAGTLPVRKPAAIVKLVKSRPAPTSVPPSEQQTRTATVATTAASESTTVNRNASNSGNASSNGHVTGKSHSIYIGHLPYDATAELVEREFNMFGRIRNNGIQVRSNNGYVFGFVDFEDASAQEKAIKMGTIRIGGKEVFIEEKKAAARADNRSGRGGYRNDGHRRGDYSNGRAYVKNDYGNRHDGEGHSRGIRNEDGYVQQNGGGRGAHQGSTPK